MSLKQQIDADLKTAMLSGDKTLVTTLRGLKSVILYAEVAKGSREEGLSDQEITDLFGKEAKKRQESADLYKRGGDETRAEAELTEKVVIEKYLPAQLSEEEVQKLVDDTITELGADKQKMGQIIGAVKAKTQGSADGALIARLVQEKLK